MAPGTAPETSGPMEASQGRALQAGSAGEEEGRRWRLGRQGWRRVWRSERRRWRRKGEGALTWSLHSYDINYE